MRHMRLIELATADDKRLGTIDFYGYDSLDLKQLRASAVP
jgi:hypothetical protein